MSLFDVDLVNRLHLLKRLEAHLAEVKKRTIRRNDNTFEWRSEDYIEIAKHLIAALDDVAGRYKELK